MAPAWKVLAPKLYQPGRQNYATPLPDGTTVLLGGNGGNLGGIENHSLHLQHFIPGALQDRILAIPSMEIRGPFNPSGDIAMTPSRAQVFSCYPQDASQEAACAEQIITEFATLARGRGVRTFGITNLIDSSKGEVRRMEFPQQPLWDYDVNATTGQYQYDVRFNGTNTNNWSEYIPEASVWRLKLGVRYSF